MNDKAAIGQCISGGCRLLNVGETLTEPAPGMRSGGKMKQFSNQRVQFMYVIEPTEGGYYSLSVFT